MLEIVGREPGPQGGLSRRAWLRLGTLAPLGLGLPTLLAANSATTSSVDRTFGGAKRCLLLFMWGGPAHQDLFDLKPDAPDGIRGEFQPISTSVPGFQMCEHLPNLAKHADKLALIRSVTHKDNNHSTAAHWMLTGRQHRLSAENFGAGPDDFPHLGSVVSNLMPSRASLPTFVALPERIATTAGAVVPGQFGGLLGKKYDPFTVDQHPDEPNFEVPSLKLPGDMDPVRVRARRDLLAMIDAVRPDLEQTREVAAMSAYHQQAVDMISAPAARKAFDLSQEPAAIRERYGKQTFGTSVLLARRLLEAGVKLVTVYWHRDKPGVDTSWDTHAQNFKQLKDRLIPQVDQPLGTLLADLADRGMLEDTLVVWFSEFGRTPKVNKNSGRDHWGACNSVWLAGAGVPGGQVYGSSDRNAAAPATDPVYPADFSATLYHLLGIPSETLIHDQQGRPLAVSEGRPLTRVLRGA